MQPTETETTKPGNLWLPYVLPFAVFMAFTAGIEPRMKAQYVWVYIAKVVVVTGVLLACRRPLRDIRFDGRMLVLGTVVGLVLCAVWVGGEKLIPYPHPAILGGRAEFNPFVAIPDAAQRAVFLVFRFFGLALMVPVMEEIFWRSFLQRYLTRPEFEELPLEKFTWGAAAIVAAMFGVTHPEWLSAVVFAFAMALLLRQTKSLFACVVAHGVTNLALGVYVLVMGDWRFW